MSTASAAKTASELVSADAVALWLDVDRSVVFRLVSKGVIQRVRRGRYDLRDSVRRAYAHLAEVAAGRGGEDAGAALAAARTTLAKEQAAAVALKNAAARGELVDPMLFEERWVAEMVQLRTVMLRLPTDVSVRLPHLSPSDVAAIDECLRALMTEAAGGEPVTTGEKR